MTAEVDQLQAMLIGKERAAQVAASYPEEYRGFVEYLGVHEYWWGASNAEGVEGVHSYEGLVLKYGYPARGADRPESVRQHKMKECYHNSVMLAVEKDWLYVEGYASSLAVGLPLPHAWCVIPETGQVVDPTWKDGDIYFGIPMDPAFAWGLTVQQKTYGILCNDWMNKAQLIRRGFTWDVDERSGLTMAIGIGEV